MSWKGYLLLAEEKKNLPFTKLRNYCENKEYDKITEYCNGNDIKKYCGSDDINKLKKYCEISNFEELKKYSEQLEFETLRGHCKSEEFNRALQIDEPQSHEKNQQNNTINVNDKQDNNMNEKDTNEDDEKSADQDDEVGADEEENEEENDEDDDPQLFGAGADDNIKRKCVPLTLFSKSGDILYFASRAIPRRTNTTWTRIVRFICFCCKTKRNKSGGRSSNICGGCCKNSNPCNCCCCN